MRAGRFKAALLLILVAASLVVPLLALANTSEAIVYEGVTNIFVRGKETAYSYNNNPPAPLKTYVQGDCPPMMMAQEIGSGRVVASGIVTECRQLPASDNFVALMDAIFKWLASGKNVLWFNGYGVYCTSSLCDNLIKMLGAKGYTITGSATAATITPDLLAPYDILVLPEMQLPSTSGAEGGNPDLLPDADVQAVKNFVVGGKGLLIMSGSDFFGPSIKGNFFRVMNKVLINLGFGWGGKLFGFQGDSVYDDVNNALPGTDVPTPGGNNYRPIVDVDTRHPIGGDYYAATRRETFRAYGGCSIVQLGPGIAVYIIPSYQVGMPGETITYRVRVFNTGIGIPGAENVDLTIDLTPSDDSGWGPTLDNYSFYLPENENKTVILSVTIPSGTRLCTEDEITVIAAAREYPDVRETKICLAHAAKRLEATQDTYVNSGINENNNYGDNTYINIGRYMEENQWAYLMFDNLAEIPSDANIIEARLYLFCWSAYGAAQEMLACEVENDYWYEYDVTWRNKPAYGATLDTKWVSIGGESEPKPYYWDVTSFIQREFAGDKVASFCVRPADNCPPSTNRRFESREWWDARLRPFLRVNYATGEFRKVSVSILPRENRAGPGSNVTFTVTVKNEGNVADTYSLSTTDNAGWGPTISPSSLSLAGGASGTATLTVTIPSGAAHCTRDNVRVTATGTGVSDNDSCIAHAYNPKVSVSISPTSQDGSPGTALTYTVTVTNLGSVADNYVLTKSDDLGWSPSLSPTTLSLAVGASDTATLTVTLGTSGTDTITVTATSQTDSTVSESANCTAHVVSVVGRVKVTIDPASKSGAPGETLNYSVTVKNEGTNTDTFSLQATDTKGWGATLSITSTTLIGGASRTGIRLSIKIPDNAADGDSTTITVTATGTGYENSATCTATKATGGIPIVIPVAAVVTIVVIISAVLVIKH